MSVTYPIENIPYHPQVIYTENLHDALAQQPPRINIKINRSCLNQF